MLITILIGVHVVLFSIASTAVQAAADRGVATAQAAPLGASSCGTLTEPYSGLTVTPANERECQGVYAVWEAMNASGGMVHQVRPPDVTVDEAGVVSVLAFGSITSPVLGPIEVVGYACGPLDLIADNVPTSADASAC